MTTANRNFAPPKQSVLTENETITSYANWQSNILFHLSLCNDFAPYLDSEWSKQGVTSRGLTDDPNTVDQADRKTAVQKVIILERMLALIAQFAPSLLRNEIIKRSTSLSSIWQRIRRHYGFNQSEVNFLNLCEIKRKESERYETYYQRIVAHIEDNLLMVASNLQHDGAIPTVDETISLTTERLAVYLWLHTIDQRLPGYVARVYAHDLQSQTLKDIQPQLSRSMDALLAELAAQTDIQIHYANSSYKYRPKRTPPPKPSKSFQSSRQSADKECSLCKATGRVYKGHNIASCWHISKIEKMEMAKALRVTTEHPIDDDDDDNNDDIYEEFLPNNISRCVCEKASNNVKVTSSTAVAPSEPQIKQVECDISPFFYAFYDHHPVHIVIDSGATSSVVSKSFLHSVGITPKNTLHSARSADKSKLIVSGEIHITLTLGNQILPLTALVIDKLDCDVLAGIPFCKRNDIHVHMKSEQITIGDMSIPYGGGKSKSTTSDIYRVDCCILRNDSSKVLMPGEFVEIQNDELSKFNGEVAIEPRADFPLTDNWPTPSMSRVIQGTIRIPNLGNHPIKLSKLQQIAQLRRVMHPRTQMSSLATGKIDPEAPTDVVNETLQNTHPSPCYSSQISVDPDSIITKQQRQDFLDLNKRFDSVFTPNFGVYNDKSGVFRAQLNMGPVEPPPTKGKLPLYGYNDLQCLQEEADKLEKLGVLGKPEDFGVTVKHVSPSFLVKQPKTGENRFVTAFNSLTPYIRLPPTASISCEDVLRRLSSYKFLIKTDLKKSFFQMLLTKNSLPYLGTVTPFKGIRIYLRPPMGMPGSSEYLQELLSRICGDFLQEGFLVINVDDMFVGGDTVQEVLMNWYRVLLRLRENNLTLSPTKTVICPKKVTILGWDWSEGTLSPNAHCVSALASVSPPKTCTSMRSFIGGYKALSKCIPKYACLLSPLEDAIKGLQGNQAVTWSPEVTESFNTAQVALKSPRTVTIPKPSDQLVLTVDASPMNKGLGATLFSQRGGKRLLSGFYSFKLKIHQNNWFPCEHEALAIAAAVNHFSPYIRESKQPLQVLTDSKPCYQAYQRLCTGQFSASARVSTFLSTLSSHNVTVHHIPGKANASSDYSSRNPRECQDESCQICSFVNNTATSVIGTVTIKDILAGSTAMPYKNTSAWKSAQHECPDLRRAYAHLTQGTRPSRKSRNLKHLRRYLNVVTVNCQGLIVVSKNDPYTGLHDLIVVPSAILQGLLTALHLRFEHATKNQLTQLFHRHYFAIKATAAIADVVNNCEQCNSLKVIPRELFEQKSTPSPTKPGEMFYADVMRRNRQKIIVTRDVHSSFTNASIMTDETANSLRDGLLITLSNIRASTCSTQVDNAPGFIPLKDDAILMKHGIKIDYGRAKNKNANSVIDKGIQEFEREMLQVDPNGGPLTAVQLQLVVETLNTRIRNRGLSAKEILFQRDQYTNDQISLNDPDLAKQQRHIREHNHHPSAISKSGGKPPSTPNNLHVGNLVFIKDEGHKNKARERYIIIKIEDKYATLQKLTHKFMSRNYKVPLALIYPACLKSHLNHYHDWDDRPLPETDSDDDDDYETHNPQTSQPEEHTGEETNVEEPTQPEATIEPRPQRTRQQPVWARSGVYEL